MEGSTPPTERFAGSGETPIAAEAGPLFSSMSPPGTSTVAMSNSVPSVDWEDTLLRNKQRLDALLSTSTAHTNPAAPVALLSDGPPPPPPPASEAAATPAAAPLAHAPQSTPLTPLEISAMGPPLDAPLLLPPRQQQQPPPQPAGPASSPPPAQVAYERLLREFESARVEEAKRQVARLYEVASEMNKVHLADSLAHKRQVWLDVSAQIWQRTAVAQSEDALKTARELKKKEEEVGDAVAARQRVADLAQEAARQEDLVQDRQRRVAKLDAELEKKSNELHLLSGSSQVERDTTATQMFFQLDGLKRREQAVAAQERTVQEALQRAEEVQVRESQVEADVTRLEQLERSLCEKEAELAHSEKQLGAEAQDYAASRERLLYEYADLAEREKEAEATQKATNEAWNAACSKQADVQVLQAALAKMSTAVADHVTFLCDTLVSHEEEKQDAFAEAATSVCSYDNYMRQRAAGRVVPSPSPCHGRGSYGGGGGGGYTGGHTTPGRHSSLSSGASGSVTHTAPGCPAPAVFYSAASGESCARAVAAESPPRQTRTAPSSAILRGGVMSPAVNKDGEGEITGPSAPEVAPPPVHYTEHDRLRDVEISLRERYGSSAPPTQVNTPRAHGAHAPQSTSNTPCATPLAARLRDRLKEESARFSYESRLKELLREKGVHAGAPSPALEAQPFPQTFESRVSFEGGVSMADEWRGVTPSVASASAPASPRAGAAAARPSQPSTPRLCGGAPRRDVMSPKVSVGGGGERRWERRGSASGRAASSSTDAVFKQIREMEDFLSAVTQPKSHPNRDTVPHAHSEAP